MSVQHHHTGKTAVAISREQENETHVLNMGVQINDFYSNIEGTKFK